MRADAGEVQSARMSHIQCKEGYEGAQSCWRNAVPQHGEPRGVLADLLPPVVLNDEIGAGRERPKGNCQQQQEVDHNSYVRRKHQERFPGASNIAISSLGGFTLSGSCRD
jgi:hypothetical protein